MHIDYGSDVNAFRNRLLYVLWKGDWIHIT